MNESMFVSRESVVRRLGQTRGLLANHFALQHFADQCVLAADVAGRFACDCVLFAFAGRRCLDRIEPDLAVSARHCSGTVRRIKLQTVWQCCHNLDVLVIGSSFIPNGIECLMFDMMLEGPTPANANDAPTGSTSHHDNRFDAFRSYAVSSRASRFNSKRNRRSERSVEGCRNCMLSSQKQFRLKGCLPVAVDASEGLYRPLSVTLLVFSWT